jgi:NAD(P)-dependent dehydrogenase (short-subunit alcohol dehydrogenase family)
MTGTKDMVHTEYLKGLASKRKLPELPWKDRTVIVVGSDRKLNVGSHVAQQVMGRGGFVIEGDKYNMKETAFHESVRQATDLVVCCASVHMAWIEDIVESDIYRVVYDSLIAPMNYASMFAEGQMEKPHRKHIVFIGSMAHSKVLNASSIYCASKAGLAHFARCAAWELTPKGFTIGIVHPGNIEGTPMTEDTIEGIAHYRGITREEAADYWASAKLTDKWLKPREVADEVMHLLTSTPHHSGVQVELAGGMR